MVRRAGDNRSRPPESGSRREFPRKSAVSAASAAPLVDQVGHDTRPARLMARPQALPAVSVVVLVEQQAIPPVRIFLKLAVKAKARTLPLLIPPEQTDHAIGDLRRHGKGRDRLA